MKLRKKRICFLLILLYLFVGLLTACYDSHVNPERHQRCVNEGVVFWFE